MTTITQLNIKEDNLDEHFVISKDEVHMINHLVESIDKQLGVLQSLLNVTGLGKTYANQHPRKVSNLDLPVIVKD